MGENTNIKDFVINPWPILVQFYDQIYGMRDRYLSHFAVVNKNAKDLFASGKMILLYPVHLFCAIR